jgi:hypothetical protein
VSIKPGHLARLLSCSTAVVACALWASGAAAQITPPGLGNANTAAWSAIGVRQSLDGAARREYLGYAGVGAISTRSNNDPYDQPAIFVFNHELYDQFREQWMYSLALSYRRQDMYEGQDWEQKRFQELRIYARYAWVLTRGRIKLLNTLRPELRGFLAPDFSPLEQPLQFRFRFKSQLACRLDGRGKQRLVAGAEVLASISLDRSEVPGWSEFAYRESRFSIFYSFRAHKRLVIDVGYMNNLIGSAAPLVDVHYFAVDLIWNNLFGTPRT